MSLLQDINWEEINPKLDEIITKNKGNSSALIEVLHKAQELIGFIPRPVQIKIAEGLGVSLGDVYSVVSFYSYFSEKPKGKYQISICKGTACYVKGSSEIIEKLEKELGIRAGDTTDDGLFSLEVVRCLGACGLGPVMTVNGTAHGLLKPDKAVEILKKYKEEEMRKTS
ncbi:MAG: hypothetical protein PWQ96_1469 [Clostridia bacterium]|nr:hypothetical protein [Clostridia bacterium]